MLEPVQTAAGGVVQACGVPVHAPLLQVSLLVQGSASLQEPGTVPYWQTPLVQVPICSKHWPEGGVLQTTPMHGSPRQAPS